MHVSFDTTRLVAVTYETNKNKWSGSSTILKIQAVLAEKIEQNVYVNQKNFLPIYTYILIKYLVFN